MGTKTGSPPVQAAKAAKTAGMSTKARAAQTKYEWSGKRFHIVSAAEYGELIESLREHFASGLCSARKRDPSNGTTHLLQAALDMVADYAAASRQCADRASRIVGSGKSVPDALKGRSKEELSWLAGVYAERAEQFLRLVDRSMQCWRIGAKGWVAPPQPKRSRGLGPDCFVEESRWRAERKRLGDQLPIRWMPGDELFTMLRTLASISRHCDTMKALHEREATRVRGGRPRKEFLHDLSGRKLAISVCEELEKNPSLKTAKALRLVAERLVDTPGHRRGTHRLDEAFEARVKEKARRLGQELSRWRLKIPTHVKQRSGPQRRPVSGAATGASLDNAWHQRRQSPGDEDGTT
jgi:hypothetical protein